jgi:hypothetical protein
MEASSRVSAHRLGVWPLLALIVMAGGSLSATVHYYAGDPDVPESVLADAAFGAPVVMAGMLAFFATIRPHPAVLTAAGLAVLPIALVSVVTWPLLLPAGLLFVRGSTGLRRPSTGGIVAGGVIAVGLPVAFVLLLVHQDPVSWQTSDRSGSSSDVITRAEAIASLLLVGVVGIVGAVALKDACRREES